MQAKTETQKGIRWDVFIPCFLVIGGAAILGVVNNAWLTKVTQAIFGWSLETFGWLYQWAALGTLILITLLAFSPVGKIRFGGPQAKAKFSFGAWFAMTLTGGIATGLITYGVNEPLIYYGSIYGELKETGVAPFSVEASFFAMARCFYNWTFIPYAMYALSGVIIAYMYYNRKKELSVAASLTPLFGERVTKGFWRSAIDTLSVLAIALSLRCIPQLHGAARKTLEDARRTLEIEMNSCCDNPILWPEPGNEAEISACNADSAYVGIAMDSACLAATMLAKISERRNNRLIDENLSGYPWFLIQNPGLNSGVMIPQYTQAGLLNQMRILCTSSVIDNTPTCGNQEDYVAMGYNAALKSLSVVEKLEYILAIELLSVYEAQPFVDASLQRSPASRKVLEAVGREVPKLEEDFYLYPHIEYLRQCIHDGKIMAWAEQGMDRKLV
ncbi:aromatic amino acid lyase [Acidaminococcus timonensis]|uniref:aromatic amino acid lyase n=1 Tax=Acidaminococcus timonensis TaxID=1871002 RepID=UPI0008DA01A8|nr:aromatic amino acid lyase [Acidaminococcus timonensis]